MPNESHVQRSAPQRALAGLLRPRTYGVMLGAVAAAALAGCAPDNGDNSGGSAASAGANGPSAAANARPANVATPQTAPACPKLVTPQCPAAPATAPTRLADTSADRSGALEARRAPTGSAGHAAWTRAHAVHHHFHRHGREWATSRSTTVDRLDGGRGEGRGLTRGDWIASERDGLLGGPAGELRGGYRIREDARETERSEVSRSFGGERVIETYREAGHGLRRPCPLDCREGWTGAGRGGDYRTAGVEGGYLVWPGKVEY